MSDGSDQVIEAPDDGVEELVHQLRFDHFRDVGDAAPAGAGHPAGFGVGAAAAGEDEHAGVGPFQRLQVGGELALRLRMVKALGVLREGPVRGGLPERSAGGGKLVDNFFCGGGHFSLTLSVK